MTVQPAGATASELAAAIASTPVPAKNITAGVTAVGRQYGIVQSIQTSTLTITLAGGMLPIAGVAYSAAYTPNVGDKVIVDQVGTDLVVIGGLYGQVASSLITGAYVHTEETTTSTTYTNLATSGPAVTIFTDQAAVVFLTTIVTSSITSGLALMSFAVSGATTAAAADATAVQMELYSSGAYLTVSGAFYYDTLNAGNNTFTAKYRAGASGGTAHFVQRHLLVLPV